MQKAAKAAEKAQKEAEKEAARKEKEVRDRRSPCVTALPCICTGCRA